jgi:murein DD-endopeptidase MepM/ murein hydrolase activator NlpD
MKKFIPFFFFILLIPFLTGCESRKGPPAPVSYGHSLPHSNTSSPLSHSPNVEKTLHHELKPKTIIVGEDETLAIIARKTSVPAYQLIELNKLKKPYTLKPRQILRLTEDAPIQAPLTDEERVSMEIISENAQDKTESIPSMLPASKPKRKLTEAEKDLIASVQQEKTVMSQESKNQQELSSQDESIPSSDLSKNSSKLVEKALPSHTAKGAEATAMLSQQAEETSFVEETKASNNKRTQLESPKFSWPVKGKIISSFGPGQGTLQNDGINIAAPKGTPIIAIEDGIVVYAGNEMQGFGNLILLKHPGGWMSSYGHTSKLLVERGTKVQKGQTIGLVGNTGSVNEPQLHFELRNMKQNGKVVNPELYLE